MTHARFLVRMAFAVLGMFVMSYGASTAHVSRVPAFPRTIPLRELQEMLRDHPGSTGWILQHYNVAIDRRKNPAPLCHPEIAQRRDSTVDEYYPAADALFRKGSYREAARAFYQMFFCENAPIDIGIDPRVSDAGVLAPFDAALSLAANGRFREAVRALRPIVRALPPFGEARYTMACFEWATGDHHAGRVDWRRTVEEPYFALPENGVGPPTIEAKRMLNWSKGR